MAVAPVASEGRYYESNKNSFRFFWVALVMFSFALCGSAAQAASFTAPQRVADYLYYMEYSNYAPNLAIGENIKQGFACSSVRNGNFYGRNV